MIKRKFAQNDVTSSILAALVNCNSVEFENYNGKMVPHYYLHVDLDGNIFDKPGEQTARNVEWILPFCGTFDFDMYTHESMADPYFCAMVQAFAMLYIEEFGGIMGYFDMPSEYLYLYEGV